MRSLVSKERPTAAASKAGSNPGYPRLLLKPAICRGRSICAKIREMGAIVEEFIEGAVKRSPSVQYRIDPLGQIEVISTHDQVLGGRSNQVFLGCRFPADVSYRLAIQEEGLKVARLLRDRGVLGRFGIDFLSVWDGSGWRHRAIEINLRKGGTTHPFMMLQFLTDGRYDSASGEFHAPSGASCCYTPPT